MHARSTVSVGNTGAARTASLTERAQSAYSHEFHSRKTDRGSRRGVPERALYALQFHHRINSQGGTLARSHASQKNPARLFPLKGVAAPVSLFIYRIRPNNAKMIYIYNVLSVRQLLHCGLFYTYAYVYTVHLHTSGGGCDRENRHPPTALGSGPPPQSSRLLARSASLSRPAQLNSTQGESGSPPPSRASSSTPKTAI